MTGHHPFVELYQDEADEFRWRRKAANGAIESESGEGYTGKEHALEQATKLNPGLEIVDEV